MTLASV